MLNLINEKFLIRLNLHERFLISFKSDKSNKQVKIKALFRNRFPIPDKGKEIDLDLEVGKLY